MINNVQINEIYKILCVCSILILTYRFNQIKQICVFVFNVTFSKCKSPKECYCKPYAKPYIHIFKVFTINGQVGIYFVVKLKLFCKRVTLFSWKKNIKVSKYLQDQSDFKNVGLTLAKSCCHCTVLIIQCKNRRLLLLQ